MTQLEEGSILHTNNSGKTAETSQDFAAIRSQSTGQVGRPNPRLKARGVGEAPDSIISGSQEALLSNGFVGSMGQKSAEGP